ncbi:MAG: amidohydrolase family protein, partial [Sediminibacterium sp.]
MHKYLIVLLGLCFSIILPAQIPSSPIVKEGQGPYTQLILRGAMVINGTGSPAYGPVDIIIENNKIVRIANVGNPGMPIDPKSRPALKQGGKEIDCSGKYVLPGLIDMHGHIGGKAQGTPAEYVFKLWMAHGITTIRDPSAGNGLEWVLDHKKKSAANSITAPRIHAYTAFGQGSKTPIINAEQARVWVNENAAKGADGIKFFGASPEVMDAAIRENKKLGLRSTAHHAQLDVARWNVVQSAKAGMTSMEHWYGLPEAMLENGTLQNYPADYNYNNEQHRFEE